MGISEWLSVIDIVVAIIGIVVGCIGGQQLKEANRLKIQFRDLKNKIEKIEVNNSQVAQTINNNGMGYKDTKELAESVVAEKQRISQIYLYLKKFHKRYQKVLFG